LTKFPLLHHQHAKQLAALDNGHTEKRAEAFLFYRGNIFKAGVFVRIGKVDGFGKAPH
jgi:hypothetical protein